jgi:anti-anti-sigma factor
MEQRADAHDLGAYGNLPPNFRLDVSHPEGETVLSLHGELDMWTQPQFERTLRDVGDSVQRLVVDLTCLTLIDAGNIGVLNQMRLLAEMRGTEFVLRSPTVHVARILELTGLWSGTADCGEPHPIVIPLPSRAYDRAAAVSDDARRLVSPVAVAQ